ncbi:legumin B-like [Papaver somniferum]|uniref:legumin B-like n=1 Tax=Papaver somniferum TaxID=3469 RepID=UPI000E6F83D7|nr:legumin B-like [Papaver somniferum]
MAPKSFFLVSLCSIIFFHGCLAQIEQQQVWGGQQQPQQQRQRQSRQESECRIENIQALEPTRTIQSEAGVTERWDENEEQLQCAGVAVTRHVIQPRGLLLPEFVNAPKLIYVVQGRGIQGVSIPGCPTTYQSFQQLIEGRSSQGQQSRYRDEHQKIRHLRQGDIAALPTGISHWFYNDGETPLVLVRLLDTSNAQNQLDQRPRRFYLAGNPQQQGQTTFERSRQTEEERSGNNIFSGFDVEMLAEAFGVSTETARSLQSLNDNRGNIVRVENGLRVIRPPRREEEEDREQRETRYNGFEETLCAARLVHNIADPVRADVYSPLGGRISSLNSQKLPILSYLQLSAERGVLYRNAIMVPHWNLNAHSIIYVTRGNGRIQIVGNYERPVFDGQVREGQILTVPQNFAVVKQAGSQGLEWVAFKTNDNAMISPLVGRISTLRAMPEDVLMNSYRISRDEARRLKFNREEMVVFAPSRSGSQQEQRWASA